jgi:hypothetical protein
MSSVGGNYMESKKIIKEAEFKKLRFSSSCMYNVLLKSSLLHCKNRGKIK